MQILGIKTIGLEKKYGNLSAVHDLNLEIPQGQFFAFLGPNAAGKTTTLRMLSGLLKPTRGEIQIRGINPQEQPLEAKKILGYIPDFPHFYEKLTAREFLEFIGKLYFMKEEKMIKRANELLCEFELESYQHRLIETFSHGIRQRLGFCATLLHEPRVLLIDEPMVGLDPKSARHVKDRMKKMTREGVTVFISTHILSVAEELADQIGIIHKGKLIATGTLSELKSRGKGAPDLENAFLEITEGESRS
ncbi:MAG: ABC transporter ATP-binding protein [Chlamydiae bacterium]|nr:ABC transporter ATP-binding protein [Chlamydiota bacterium]MBI3276500.1 ABC transporter ATP-binding protein [Chlamydiota bacterium]